MAPTIQRSPHPPFTNMRYTHQDRGSPFEPPPPTEYNFISLGGGVQSSTMALMAAKGLITPMPDAAIFADTMAEPKAVYDWLDWLIKQLPFPVHIVTNGSLTERSLTLKPRKTDPTKMRASILIPAYIRNPDGKVGIFGRSCTKDYKVIPVTRKARELAKIKHGQKWISETRWVGISWDEMQRMKNPVEPWSWARWPLIERKMTRANCIQWMLDNGYPKPPRSACVYCPFRSNDEWRKMKDEEPEEFQRAVEFEREMQRILPLADNAPGIPFLHDTIKPLDQVNLLTDKEMGQGTFDFQSECEGMCGI